MSEYQNLILSVLSAVVGGLAIMSTWLLFVVKTWQDSINQLRVQDSELRKEIGAIDLLVAGQYVTETRFATGMREQREQFKGDLASQTGTLMAAIERIDKKLDGKQDK